MAGNERKREEWIRQSSQERSFLDTFIGAPHPASRGSGRSRSSRRRTAVALAVVVLIVVPLAFQLIQSLAGLVD